MTGPDRAPAALRVIAAFGGIRPMAAKLGVAVTTVQGWKERASIPAARRDQIVGAAAAHGIDVPVEDLDSMSEAPSKTEDTAAASADRPATRQAELAAKPESEGRSKPPAAPVAPIPPPRASPAPQAGLGPSAKWAMIAVVLAAVGLGIGFLAVRAGFFAMPPGPGLSNRLQALEKQIGALEAAVPPAPSTDVEALIEERTGALALRLGDAERRLAAIAEQPPVVPDLSRIDDLAAQVADAGRRVDDMQAALDVIGQHIADLEVASRETAAAPVETALMALRDRLDAAEGRLDDIGSEVALIGDRLNARQAAQPSQAAGAVVAIIAVERLGRAIETGGPYRAELNPVSAYFDARAEAGQALAELDRHADSGVPPASRLLVEAAGLERWLPRPQSAPIRGWLDIALDRLQSLVVIRRPADEAKTEGPAAANIAAARAAIGRGDLAAAVAAIDGIGDSLDDPAQRWLERARSRLAVDRGHAALDALAAFEVLGQAEAAE